MTTRIGIRHKVAYALDDMLVPAGVSPTATAGTALADTVNLRQADNDAINGAEVYIYESGTASVAGQKRWIEDYIASSSLVTVAAWTATPNTGDKYEMHQRFRVDEYNEAIAAAHDESRLNQLLPKIDEAIILDNLVPNGLMANWDDSTTLTGWGAGGTGVALARESNERYSRYYSAKLTNQASQEGTLSYYIRQGAHYGGQTVSVRAWAYCKNTSRLRAFLVSVDSAGNSQTTYSAYHNGKGWNAADDLKIEVTIGEAIVGATQDTNYSLRPGIEIASGTAISVYLGRIEVTCAGKDLLPNLIYEYDIPSGFVSIKEIWMERATHNVFDRLDARDWSVVQDATRRLRIHNPTSRRAIRVIGLQKATAPAADSASISLNEEFLVAYSCWYLLQMHPQVEDATRIAYWANRWRDLARRDWRPKEGRNVEMVG